MACNGYVTIKILELLLCIACMVYKRISDEEGRRFNKRLEKQSYEWPLLRYITWEQNGSSYADITYGSYVIITAGLLVGFFSGELLKARNTEGFLLGFGALLFIGVGSLELAALDSVPEPLIKNAAILGVVSLLTGGLFILDLLLSGKRRKAELLRIKAKQAWPSKLTQTEDKSEYSSTDLVSHKMNGLVINGGPNDKHEKVVGQLKSSLKGRKSEGEPMRVTFPSEILDPGLEAPGHNQTITRVRDRGDRDSNLQETERWSVGKRRDEGDRELQRPEIFPEPPHLQSKLRRGDKIPKLPSQPPKPFEESDGDDSLTVPSVAFIMGETGDQPAMTSLRPKSPSLRTKMLPMAPIDMHGEKVLKRSPKNLQKSMSQPVLSKEVKLQKYEDDSDIPEVVVLTPTQKHEFLAYKKMIMDLTKEEEERTAMQRNRKGATLEKYDGEIKSTYATDEIVEPPYQMRPSDKEMFAVAQKPATKTKPKPQSKNNKMERPKGYVAPDKGEEVFPDFSEDISFMSPSERERYLFGESPKDRASTPSSSPAIQAATSNKGILRKPSSNSPEEGEEQHWRFDSRDANLLQSFRKSPRDSRDSPSSPLDPGYVLHTAQNWPSSTPHSTPKTPSQSPTEVASGTSPQAPYRISSDESDTNSANRNGGTSSIHSHPKAYLPSARMSIAPPPLPLQPPPMDSPDTAQRKRYLLEEDDISPGGSLTTQLLQKWIKQRSGKVTKMRSDP